MQDTQDFLQKVLHHDFESVATARFTPKCKILDALTSLLQESCKILWGKCVQDPTCRNCVRFLQEVFVWGVSVQFLANPSFTNNGENYTYSISIILLSWTMDDQIRNALNTLYCEVNYIGNVCRTESVNIIFTDTGKFSYWCDN